MMQTRTRRSSGSRNSKNDSSTVSGGKVRSGKALYDKKIMILPIG
jgi:hypothetical protein